MTDQVAMDRIAQLRTFYARYVAAKGNARDPRVERAFATVAREPFAGPGPWSVLALGYKPRRRRPTMIGHQDFQTAWLASRDRQRRLFQRIDRDGVRAHRYSFTFDSFTFDTITPAAARIPKHGKGRRR